MALQWNLHVYHLEKLKQNPIAHLTVATNITARMSQLVADDTNDTAMEPDKAIIVVMIPMMHQHMKM